MDMINMIESEYRKHYRNVKNRKILEKLKNDFLLFANYCFNNNIHLHVPRGSQKLLIGEILKFSKNIKMKGK